MTKRQNKKHAKNWRDKKKLKGLCIFCGKGKPAKDRVKCKLCLIRSAWHQSEYRERKKREQQSFRSLNLYPIRRPAGS